jgi:hypothetical protein
MAEERLTDTDLDKDKKYRIRKNEDGENELVVDDEEESEEEVEFSVPDFAYDVENVENLTPEEYENFLKKKDEEERLREEQKQKNLQDAQTALNEKEYESALYHADAVLQVEEDNAQALGLKLRALSRNFTDLIELSACADCAESFGEVATPAQKQAMLTDMTGYYQTELSRRKAHAQELGEENEAKKADRRGRFLAKRKVALTRFLVFFVPFVVFLGLAIGFACVITARQDGLYLILTAVTGGLAVALLVLSLIFSRGLIDAQRKVRLNEKDTSTKLGREWLAVKDEMDKIERILNAVTVSEEELAEAAKADVAEAAKVEVTEITNTEAAEVTNTEVAEVKDAETAEVKDTEVAKTDN